MLAESWFDIMLEPWYDDANMDYPDGYYDDFTDVATAVFVWSGQYCENGEKLFRFGSYANCCVLCMKKYGEGDVMGYIVDKDD